MAKKLEKQPKTPDKKERVTRLPTVISPIDTKFKFQAISVEHHKVYSERDAIVFCVHDRALLAALNEYYRQSVFLNADEEQVWAIERLIGRVENWQREHPDKLKVADVLLGKGV